MMVRSPGRRAAAGAAWAVACASIVVMLSSGCDDSAGTPTPQPRFDTTFLDFGDVAFGASQERSFTLTNAGGGSLEGAFAGTVCDPPSDPAATPCWSLVGETSYRLAANQSKTFTVKFAPYDVAAGGGSCGTGSSHCQVESAHGIVHCGATGVAP
jgi:hypothetical protein